MQRLFALFLFPILLHAGNEDSSKMEYDILISPSFQRISCEAAIASFLYGYSGTFDGSLFRIQGKKNIELGGRMAFSKWNGGYGGESTGKEEFAQVIDVLLLATMKYSQTRANAFAGYSYMKFLGHTTDQPLNMLKYGVEIDWLFLPPIASLMVRAGITSRVPIFSLAVAIGYFN